MSFRAFSRNEAVFATFRSKVHRNVKTWYFGLGLGLSGSFCEKARKIVNLVKTLQLWEQATMSLHFDELFRKKLQKVPRFLKTHEKSSILSKLATFRKNYHVWRFDEVFSKKLQKVPRFVKKHEKSTIWPKLCNFSSKLPCFGISMKFSGKICKRCLIS